MAERRNKKSSRAELEAELEGFRRREALYNETEAFPHIGHFEWNIEARCFESCSPAFASIFALSRETVLDPKSGLSAFIERVHQDDREKYQALYDELGETGLLDCEFRVLREDGGIRNLFQVGIDFTEALHDGPVLPGILHDISAHEFLVILSGLPELSIVERVAGNLIRQVSQPIAVEHHQVSVGTSIGVALYPEDASDSDELIRVADKAMYLIKHSGKNNFGFARSRQLN